MKALVHGFLLVLCLSLFTSTVSASHDRGDTHRAGGRTFEPTVLAQASISAEDAAALVQAQTGGRILAVKLTRVRGRAVYRIKVLTPKGEVRIYYVDAATGTM
jgi:uncharacterized membrane protein YkoI